MLDATCLYHLRWRKKKVDKFIIPPTYFRKNDYSIVESQKPKVANTENAKDPISINKPEQPNPVAAPTESLNPKPEITDPSAGQPKVSAFSLASIRAKKALEESKKTIVRETVHMPTESFSETEMLLQWNRYAQRLGDKGFKIMESLLLINDPKLNGTSISIELPNEGSKLDFEKELNGLLGHLKGHLHNHNITIDVIVNESVETKRSLNDQDRYNRLLEINPNIELLRKTFGLDLDA